MGYFCDGRASLVIGTHSHVPTADAQILTGGTAYKSDAGMRRLRIDHRQPEGRADAAFHDPHSGGRFQPALGVATLAASRSRPMRRPGSR